MRSLVNPLASSIAYGIGAAALLLLGGCESDRAADNVIEKKINQAVAHLEIHSEASDAEARKALDEAAKETAGSPGMRAQLAAMRGQLQLDSAGALMRKIDQHELDLTRVSFDLGQLAMQLDTGNVLTNEYSKYDPKETRNRIAQQITDAQGGPSKPTWEYESVQMPTIAAITVKTGELEAQLAKLDAESKQLAQQREELLKQAGEASTAAENAKGQESLDAFKRGSDLRRQAGELFIKMDQLTAAAIPVARELSIAQGQLQVLNEIVKQLQTQQASLDSGWQAIQQQIAAQNELAKRIVGSDSASPGTGAASGATIGEKAADINRLSAELRNMRQQAQSQLDDAVKLFKDAYDSAVKLDQELGQQIAQSEGGSGAAMYKTAREIVNPPYYRLREAGARRMMGALFTSEAASIANRVNLGAAVAPIIERGGGAVPADLRPGNLSRDQEAAARQADDAYKAATELLTGITNGTSSAPMKHAAKVELIVTYYGWSQAAQLLGDAGGAKSHLEEAKRMREEAAADGAALPALPNELAPVAVAKPTTAPAAPTAASNADTAESTPVRAIAKQAADALDKGDLDALKAVSQIAAGEEETPQLVVTLVADAVKFRAAVTEKFGQPGAAMVAVLPNLPERLRTAKIVVKGDSAFLESGEPIDESDPDFTKIDGQWKITFNVPKDDKDRLEKEMIVKYAAALPALTADITAGKFPTLQDMQKAMATALGMSPPNGDSAPPATQP